MALFKPILPLLPAKSAPSDSKSAQTDSKSDSKSDPKSSTKSSAKAAKTASSTGTKIAGKKTPTPKRKEAQALNQHPVIVKDRKLARKRSREMQARERNTEYLAMKTGDIDKMPLKDRGEEKLFIRNFVDSRFHLSQLFIPIAFTLVLAMFTPLQSARVIANILVIVVYCYTLACAVEIFFRWRTMKALMRSHFGPNLLFNRQGYLNYMFIRMLQFPRMRLPKALPKAQIAQMMERKRG
jgi:hypothetical protein